MSITRLMAVDGTGLLVRCSRAARLRPIATSDGVPTAALTAFAGSLARYVRDLSPNGVIIAWDGRNSTLKRREIVPGYKAGRAGFSLLGSAEAAQAFEFCAAAGMAQWCDNLAEADDLLAAVAAQVPERLPDARVLLVSDDADLLQLAADGRVMVVRRDALYDATRVEEQWGVPPRLLPALRALSGDSSDGIPGIRGIGPARALKVLRTGGWHWPLPNLLLDPADKAQAERWYSVMDLIDPVRRPDPDVLDVRKSAWNPSDGIKVQAVLDKYELKKLAERNQAGILWSVLATA